MAWESLGKVVILVHDESWINENPSAMFVWLTEAVKSGVKIEGRRFAFADLWSYDSGLVSLAVKNESLDTKIERYEGLIKDSFEVGIDTVKTCFHEAGLSCPAFITLDKASKIDSKSVGESSFFCFDVKTANQNGGVSRQMDSAKFLASIKQIVLHRIKDYPIGTTIVVQLDNATYHHTVADNELRM